MEEFYEKILKKPKSYRRKLAYLSTIIFGLIIFSLWIFMTINNLEKNLGNINPKENLQQKLPSLKEKYQEQVDTTQEIKKELNNLGF